MKLKPNNTNKSFLKSIPSPIRSQINHIRFKLYNGLYSGKSYTINNHHLFWHNTSLNFGDWISPYLYKKMVGNEPCFTPPNANSHSTSTLSVGSIISKSKPNSIIWGSGIMSKNVFFPNPFKVLAVRGPLTRNRFLELGYKCPKIYGDPALLLPKYFNPKIKTKYKLGIIPHYVDYKKVKKKYSNIENIKIINVLDSVENVITHILSCENIISSSLHGCIVACIYKKDFVWSKFSNKLPGDDIKFYDFFNSINLDVTSPLDLTRKMDINDLLLSIKDSPQINIENLNTDKLADSCPFIYNSNDS